jgi:hypothetical protein
MTNREQKYVQKRKAVGERQYQKLPKKSAGHANIMKRMVISLGISAGCAG